MHPPPRPGRPALACDVAVGILSVSHVARESDVRDIHFPRRDLSRHLLASCVYYAMTPVPRLTAELDHMHEWVQTQVSCGLDPTAVAKCKFDKLPPPKLAICET
eukprot:9470720-Pyramimonas_sp.AAC.1